MPTWDLTTPWPLLLKGTSLHSGELARLLAIYRSPVQAYFRYQGLSPEDAEDLTQSLLMDFFLVKHSHRRLAPARGRFRDYLRRAARHLLLDFRKYGRAKRRGGGQPRVSLEELKSAFRWEPAGGADPEEEFDRQWARATWWAAWERFRTAGSRPLVEALERCYGGEEAPAEEHARQLGISVAAFNSRLHKGRCRLRDILRELVAATVEGREEVDRELQRLRELLGRGIP
jgi:DNA-directed RNA polymerase specialized sigma24 family protein